MSTNLKTLHPKDKLKKANAIFEEYNIHHIPIEVMGDIKGILSMGDILFIKGMINNSFDQFLQSMKFDTLTVDEIMTTNPYFVNTDATIGDALDLMLAKGVNALLVAENNKLSGIVTSQDIMKYFQSILKK
jgi:CBS domain-containing protein